MIATPSQQRATDRVRISTKQDDNEEMEMEGKEKKKYENGVCRQFMIKFLHATTSRERTTHHSQVVLAVLAFSCEAKCIQQSP